MTKRAAIPSRETIEALLIYNRDAGLFVWRVQRGPRKAGEVAGGFDKDGYRRIKIGARQPLASHLVWMMEHGELPPHDLDHHDLNRSNDRIGNLRPATRRQNIANTGLRSTNTSGHKGVYFCRQSKLWRARIRVAVGAKTQKHLGSFNTAAEAGVAYANAAREMYGEFARVK